MKNPKFECKKGKDGKYYFNLKAKNGEVILTSQGYASRSGLQVGVESTKKNAVNMGSFEILKTITGAPYFVLKAGNGEVVGKSEMYSSKEAMQNGINSVSANAAEAELEWAEESELVTKTDQ